jgi:hypothetical protein
MVFGEVERRVFPRVTVEIAKQRLGVRIDSLTTGRETLTARGKTALTSRKDEATEGTRLARQNIVWRSDTSRRRGLFLAPLLFSPSRREVESLSLVK